MSSWAAVLIALAGLAGVLAGRIWNIGRREGAIDQILKQLTELVGDLDDRVRVLEHRPARRRRG